MTCQSNQTPDRLKDKDRQETDRQEIMDHTVIVVKAIADSFNCHLQA